LASNPSEQLTIENWQSAMFRPTRYREVVLTLSLMSSVLPESFPGGVNGLSKNFVKKTRAQELATQRSRRESSNQTIVYQFQ
jgi:hypothetical protein